MNLTETLTMNYLSNSISSCLRWAKRSLLVGTCAYLPFTVPADTIDIVVAGDCAEIFLCKLLDISLMSRNCSSAER
jgi:hypothetical protein